MYRALSRSLLTDLAPNNGVIRCNWIFAIVLFVYFLAQVLMQPRKIPLANHLDSLCSIVHIFASSMTAVLKREQEATARIVLALDAPFRPDPADGACPLVDVIDLEQSMLK